MIKHKYIIISSCFLVGLLFSCGKPQVESPEITSEPSTTTPVLSLEPNNPATPTEEITPLPTQPDITPELTISTPTPTLEPVFISEPNMACMYLNYANSFPLVVTENYSVQFHYNDSVSVVSETGHCYSFCLSQNINVDGLDLSDPDLWYFCGAFQSEQVIFAHYDYLNNDEAVPSLLIKIIPGEETATVLCYIQSQNPKKHFQDCFLLAGNYIYYTDTRNYSPDNTSTVIQRKDINSEITTIYYEGNSGETIHYMTTDGNYLSYIVTKSDGTNQLICVNLTTGHNAILSDHLAEPDFLIGWNGYVFTNSQDGKLSYFNCQIPTKKTITYSDDTMISAGYPLTDGESIYLPLVDYSELAGTILLPLDLVNCNILEEIHVDDTFHYSVGMIDNYLYTENMESFLIFDIKGQN